MIQSDAVPRYHVGHHSGGDRLFTGAQMHFSGYPTLLPQVSDSQFKGPRSYHVGVEVN